jgi:endonuclease/exonuclease/phosphatase family metal-dependent hydrolase
MRRAFLAIAVVGTLSGCALLNSLGSMADPPVLRVATYNIRHGRGMDDRVALERTATALRMLDADIIGLQEVDRRATRSGNVDQAEMLAGLLGMRHAFGAFMDHDGGEYGMAILSRHRIVGVQRVRLPEGEEPRIALSVSVELPGYDTVTVVNVHFDWVNDDAARYRQARAVAAHVDTLSYPWLLLGDFNDSRSSRTLRLFRDRVRPERKPSAANETFPADDPVREIDYVLASQGSSWEVREIEVVADSVTSDHRPVVATVRRRGG